MKKQISINIGDYYASKEPSVLHTVLGSCVAVCLMDHENRIGGMNHILLPGKADLKHLDHCTRYGINAMELLIRKILNLGGQRRHLAAKIFGGGNMLPTLSGENRVGRENVAFAMSYLHNKRIRIKSRDVGGNFSRKIYFHTDTGSIFLKRIQASSLNQTVEEK
jgi:chemotaxis protein CheD